jgi:cytochrome b561
LVKDASITKAKEALTSKAIITRNAATILWTVLLVLTIVLIFRGVFNSRSQKEPFKYYGR